MNINMDDLYVAEYSIIQKAFNICTIKEAIISNIKSISSGINTGYQIIAVGTHKECVDICDMLKEKIGKRN